MARNLSSRQPVGGQGTSTFESLAVREYRLLFIAGTISFLSVQAQVVARGWLANELTDSNAALGGVYMAFGVPMLLATPFGGAMADRVSKRMILIVTQLILSATAAWLGVAVLLDAAQYWMLLAVSAIQAVSFAFLGPARIAMTGEVVGRRLLTNAIVLSQVSLNSSRVIGPSLAGIGIGIVWFGTAGVYLVAAVLSAASVIAVLPLPHGRTPRTGEQRSARSEFLDGLRYARRDREMAILLWTSFVVVMVGFPYLAFLPRVSSNLLNVGAAGYGALSAASAVGAVIISVWIAGRGSRRSPWNVQAVSGVVFGVAVIALAASPSIAVALATIAVVGAGASGFQAMNNSLALNIAAFEFHGRIQSLMMLSFSGFGMAALPLGALADVIGLRQTLAAMGSIVIVAITVSQLALRKSDQRQSIPFA
ncbi:MAG: MFS transporter [Actinomycetota bacterium]|nr:MFS transporter [Actinomycetota bacterium]